jgi:hypothetical protein
MASGLVSSGEQTSSLYALRWRDVQCVRLRTVRLRTISQPFGTKPYLS